jgi:hypothetical protein
LRYTNQIKHMKNIVSLLNIVSDEATQKLVQLQELFGVESEHSSNTVLLIKGENSQVNLEGGRYLTEIDCINEILIDDNGYEYQYDCIPFDDLCQIIDNQETQHGVIQKTPLTAELLETYNFKKTRNQTCHDDVGYDYELPLMTLLGFFQINGEPCEIDALEGEYYTDEGEAHDLYIDTKEQLDALLKLNEEDEIIEFIENIME